MKTTKKEQGQGLVEYALILVLVAIVIIVILQLLGASINLAYARVIAALNGQTLTGTGIEYVVTNFEVSVIGAGVCTVSVSDATIIAMQDGELLTSGAAAVPVVINNNPVGNLTGPIGGNGIATTTNTVSDSTSCSGTVMVGAASQGY